MRNAFDMGFLDFLFSFKKKRTQPTQPFRAPGVSLSELARRAEEAKRREIEAALPEADAATRRIKERWLSLQKRAAQLARKPVERGIDGERVAEQSRDAFARRVEVLFKTNAFPPHEFDAFVRFAREFEETLHKLARALSDNKYLFLFFRDDAEEIGRAINELNDETLALKHSLDAARKNSERYALLLRRIGKLQSLKEKNAEFENAVRAAEEEVKCAEEKEKQALVEFNEEENRARQVKVEITALENDAWTAENEAAQILSSLQRPFRKLEKLLEYRASQSGAGVDKRLLQTLRDYAENSVSALEKDEGAKNLAFACSELEKNLADVGLDFKEAEKATAAVDAVRSGKIASLASVRREALARKTQKSEALAPLEKANRVLEEASAARREATLKLKAAQARLAENAAAIRCERDAIDKAANSLFKLSLAE
ncbi:MAG: hypothetical protein QW343_02950 [Candidatus Norongarragalinales archaeon]